MKPAKELISRDRYAAHNNIVLIEVEPGFARAEMEITEHHLNGVNITHGGAIFTLADLAFAAASNSHGTVAVGISATITYLKATHQGKLTASAREVGISPKLATYKVEVKDDTGELIAIFQGTVYRKSTPLTQATDKPDEQP